MRYYSTLENKPFTASTYSGFHAIAAANFYHIGKLCGWEVGIFSLLPFSLHNYLNLLFLPIKIIL